MSAYDTPFAGMVLPLSRKSTRPIIPAPRPSYTNREELREAGSSNTEVDGVDGIGLSSRHVDGSAKALSSTLQNYTEQSTDKTIAGSCELGDGDNVLASVTSQKTGGSEAQPISPDEKELATPLTTMEGHDGEISNNQDKLPDSEAPQERDEQFTSQLLETELCLDTEFEEPVSRTIHILGNNAIGKFFAHALAGAPKAPPITLLMHRPWLIKKWLDGDGTIRLIRDGRIDEQSGFNVELTDNFSRDLQRKRSYRPRDTLIDNLVVTTEGYTTVTALAAIRHRLQHSSTICFTQNSVGIIDYVNSLFPDATQRPNYILGSISHEVHSSPGGYSIVEHEIGKLAFTAIPRTLPEPQLRDGEATIRRMDLSWQPSSKYLMRTFHRAPDLCATSLNTGVFYKQQLENLAITSVLGPVSVVYECFNSQLLDNREASRTIRLLLREISSILPLLPEVSQIPSVGKIFSYNRLEKLVFSAIEKSGKNRTSMLLDVMEGKKTKIDFYNGYLLRRADELGIDCPRLEMITSMVKGKQSMRSRERNTRIPLEHQQ